LFKARLVEMLARCNPFNLKMSVKTVGEPNQASFDLVLQSANKDPHSGITGGPFPIPEIQLARMIDRLIGEDGVLCSPELQELCDRQDEKPVVTMQALFADHDGSTRVFDDSSAKALVEIRLAPGNKANQASLFLKEHLVEKILPGFALDLGQDKDGAEPWMTAIDQPVFALILEALEAGYSQIGGGGPKACLYGCGGSIPFVQKLMTALGNIYPLCIGAYDPDSRMHEPNESLSMADLLGCARSMVYFLANADRAFPKKRI
jgi:acetylornithine deacetylase/succinyl-diaminopimelate desuccinylase-like protein